MATQLLEPNPDVSLNIFDKMANMNVAVCVRQRGGHENLTRHFWTFRSTKIYSSKPEQFSGNYLKIAA
jgi:hypothetical protein